MGSFNTTCAISHTPIRNGDKVRLFFLASKGFYSDKDAKHDNIGQGCQCYPWDDFQVIGGYPLKAEYADYNTFDFDEESTEAKFIMKILKEKYRTLTEEDKTQYAEEEYFNIQPSDITWEHVFEFQHRGYFLLKNAFGPQHGTCFLGFMAIHESVYQVMLNETYQKYVGYPEGMNYKEAREAGYSAYEDFNFKIGLQREMEKDHSVVRLMKAQEIMKEYFGERLEDGTMTEEQAMERAFRLVDNRSSSSERYNYAFGTYSLQSDLREFISDNNSDEHNEKLTFSEDDIRKLDYEAVFFNSRMLSRNYMYRPLITSGQEHDLSTDAVFLHQMAEAVAVLGARWEEDEHVLTRKVTESYQELHLDEIYEKFEQWGEETTELQECIELLFEGTETEVLVTVEDFKKPENKILKDIIWNTNLDLRISCAHKPK